MSRPLRVFLCHASQDKPAVRELYERLDSEGWMDIWLDEEKLYPGQDWDFEIEKAVEAADVVIVCLSNNSVTKEGYVQRELRFVLQIADYKPDGTIFVVPVRLDDCPLPRRLKIWQYIDFFPKNRMDWAYRRLLGSLQMRAENLGLSPKENERTEHEAAEKAAREQAEREAAERLARKENARRQTKATPPQSFPIPVLVLGGIFLLILFFWGISALLNREPAAPPPEQSTATVTITPAVPTHTLTATHTSAPPTFTATPGIRSTMVSEKDGMVMVYIPAGEFTMGSDNGEPDEKPVHQVYLDAFWIDQTEVTNAMFAEFVEKDSYTTDAEKAGRSYVYQGGSWTQVNGADWQHPLGPASGITDIMNYPVVHVSWNDAKAYCFWADRSLPTEAEWEKAASWDDEKAVKRIYPWDNEFDGSRLNFCDKNCPLSWSDKNSDDGYEFTSPVGNYVFGRSPYGTYDMAGNVWEWVSSLYKNYPYSADDGRENLSASGSRVLRGGSWNDGGDAVRSANRHWYDPTNSDYLIGFRCALASP